jgi:hypothetical protein
MGAVTDGARGETMPVMARWWVLYSATALGVGSFAAFLVMTIVASPLSTPAMAAVIGLGVGFLLCATLAVVGAVERAGRDPSEGSGVDGLRFLGPR